MFSSTSLTLEAAVALKGPSGVVVMSMGPNKFFAVLPDTSVVAYLPPELCLCEVVVHDTARPYVDFDGDIRGHMDSISMCIRDYVNREHGCMCVVWWKWSRGASGTDVRWHCVVSGIYYDTCWKDECAKLAKCVVSTCNIDCVDLSVYRFNSSLRMVGQFKYKDGEYCRRLHPHVECKVSSICVSPSLTDTRILGRSPGLNSTRVLGSTWKHTPHVQLLKGLILTDVSHMNNGMSLWRLRRVSPWYCPICKRTHENNNAYVLVGNGIKQFRCYMAPGAHVNLFNC